MPPLTMPPATCESRPGMGVNVKFWFCGAWACVPDAVQASRTCSGGATHVAQPTVLRARQWRLWGLCASSASQAQNVLPMQLACSQKTHHYYPSA